jgi:hypothetical protein
MVQDSDVVKAKASTHEVKARTVEAKTVRPRPRTQNFVLEAKASA